MNTTTNHPLSAFVPHRGFELEYVSRKIEGVRDLDILSAAHRLHKNVLLEGPTGAAKTSFAYAYAASVGLPIVNVPCNGGADIRQLMGGWHPLPDGTWGFTPGDLVLGARHGAVILFNEINFLPAKIAAFVYGMLDKRRTVYLPDAAGSDFPTQFEIHHDTLILADYNPGYVGTRPLSEALKNRFSIPLLWDYDRSVEQQLVVSPSLLDMAFKLRDRAAVGDITTPVSTNALMEFEEFVWDRELGFDFAVSNFISRFDADERKVVREVVVLFKDRIHGELVNQSTSEDHAQGEFTGRIADGAQV